MIEKQQRAYFKQTGKAKPISEILSESRAANWKPLFRGTVPLMGHSLASATLGLVGQPKLQRWVKEQVGSTGKFSGVMTGLIASAVCVPYPLPSAPPPPLVCPVRVCGSTGSRLTKLTACRPSVSPIYVAVTNPLSRLEVIMQTSSISGKAIGVTAAIKEVVLDSKKFGMRGVFRGQGIGIAKAIVSLSMFHEVRHSACHRLPWAAVCLLSLSLSAPVCILSPPPPPARPAAPRVIGLPAFSICCLSAVSCGWLAEQYITNHARLGVQGRIWLSGLIRDRNERLGYIPE